MQTTDTLARTVHETWAAALGHDRFTDDDYFFSVGGTSLSALKVAARLTAALGRQVPVRLIFTCQTVSALTAALAQPH
ncbi:phosphopantetheine-binding protein [Kitasatospora cineracea]|uniref:phosphopantetheine-binding protein n=1 Tax=Kitasatospora cineracea TaxID=88074 RepID=UPI00368F5436